jgi:acyl carrier protein
MVTPRSSPHKGFAPGLAGRQSTRVRWHHVGMVADRELLKRDLKQLVLSACQKDVDVTAIDDGEILIGGPLALDSLDALQICMEVKERYGVRLEGGPDTRRALRSINALADAIIGAERHVPAT